MSEFREQWKDKVTWSESVFDAAERFVELEPEERIREFVETGDLSDLFADRANPPDPYPHAHREYMLAYAEHYLEAGRD